MVKGGKTAETIEEGLKGNSRNSCYYGYHLFCQDICYTTGT